MPNREDLIEEVINNARRDRRRLEAVADGLAHGFAKVPRPGEEGQDDDAEAFNPDIAAAYAEEISHIADSLSRINQQLVELVKSERKNVQPEEKKKLSPTEVEEALDKIQPEEMN